jgi:hypothetical protein
LQLIGVRNALVLDLKTQREIPFFLQIRGHDLAQTFGGSERRGAAQKNKNHCRDDRDVRRDSFMEHVQHGASKTVAVEFVDSMLNARAAILRLR